MTDFDRLRPRGADGLGQSANGSSRPRADADGKRALFSVDNPPQIPAVPAVATGGFRISCSGCGTTTALTPRQVLSAAIPSVHLPILRRSYPSLMRCPACRKRRWVRVELGRG
ncbi:MAG: hypothetical protein ACT4P1_16775 [Sporichthyaceae bacterium]